MSVRSRLGYRVIPTLSLGLEGIVDHADLTGQIERLDPRLGSPAAYVASTRLGVFARYEWFGGEVSLSAGNGAQLNEGGGDYSLIRKANPYATANILVQF